MLSPKLVNPARVNNVFKLTKSFSKSPLPRYKDANVILFLAFLDLSCKDKTILELNIKQWENFFFIKAQYVGKTTQ